MSKPLKIILAIVGVLIVLRLLKTHADKLPPLLGKVVNSANDLLQMATPSATPTDEDRYTRLALDSSRELVIDRLTGNKKIITRDVELGEENSMCMAPGGQWGACNW